MKALTDLGLFSAPRLKARNAELEAAVGKLDAAQRDLSVRLVRQTQVTAEIRSERMELERKLEELTSVPQKELFENWIEAASETFRQVAQHDLSGSGDFQRRLVAGSGFFDERYYVAHNPGAVEAGSPLDHFMSVGGPEGRAPGPRFDGAAYLSDHADVARAGLNPLVHYLVYGFAEGRRVRGVQADPDGSGP